MSLNRCICGKEKSPGEDNCCIYVVLHRGTSYTILLTWINEYNRRTEKSIWSLDEITRDDIDMILYWNEGDHEAKNEMYRFDPIIHQIVHDGNIPVTLSPIRLDVFRAGFFDIDDSQMADRLIINTQASEIFSKLQQLQELTWRYEREKYDQEKVQSDFLLQLQSFISSEISSEEKVSLMKSLLESSDNSLQNITESLKYAPASEEYSKARSHFLKNS